MMARLRVSLFVSLLPLFGPDAGHDALLQIPPQHVPCVVRAHSQIWILEAGDAFDGCRLGRCPNCHDNGGAMAVTDRAVEIPWNIWKAVGEWLQSQGLS